MNIDWASLFKIIQTVIAVLSQVMQQQQAGGGADPQKLRSVVSQSGVAQDKQHHIEQAVQSILEAARSR